MSTEIKWEDPASSQQATASSDLDAVADQIKANPGRWALVHEGANPGSVKNWQRRGLETTSRRDPGMDPGRVNIYARYNPEAA